jgi:hypothetical protein
MKRFLSIILIVIAPSFCSSQNLPFIDKSDGSFMLFMDKYDDTPLIFGYSLANVQSEKVICFSSYTSDVENNPNNCQLGSYYTTIDLNIAYVATEGDFVKLKFIANGRPERIFYIEKKNVLFE